MATLFLDTSAVVRRYDITEPESEAVRAICSDAENTLIVSRLIRPEVASAFNRKSQSGAITPEVRDRFWTAFESDCARSYRILELDRVVFEHAEALLFRRSVRSGDALHIGTALIAARQNDPGVEFTFWTADRRQAEAARAEGLDVRLVG